MAPWDPQDGGGGSLQGTGALSVRDILLFPVLLFFLSPPSPSVVLSLFLILAFLCSHLLYPPLFPCWLLNPPLSSSVFLTPPLHSPSSTSPVPHPVIPYSFLPFIFSHPHCTSLPPLHPPSLIPLLPPQCCFFLPPL